MQYISDIAIFPKNLSILANFSLQDHFFDAYNCTRLKPELVKSIVFFFKEQNIVFFVENMFLMF